MIDEASSLGGHCAPLTPGKIIPDNGFCLLCDFGRLASETKYENVVEDVESGYGGKTCGDVVAAAYIDLTIDSDRCPAVTKAAQEAGCCSLMCDLCSIGKWIPKENRNFTVNVPMAGYENATCGTLFLAAYWYGSVDLKNCPLVGQAAKDAGCCAPYGCFTCGARSSIDGDFSDETNCADLRAASYGTNETMPDEACLAAVQLAQDDSCCTPVRTYDSCNFCGEATFYPDNWVYKVGSCSYVQSLFSEAFCAKYTPVYAPFCCGPAPESSEPTEEATKAPAGSSSTSPPPSAAATVTAGWFPRTRGSTLVSIMMGLTAVAAGSLMMNGYLMFLCG